MMREKEVNDLLISKSKSKDIYPLIFLYNFLMIFYKLIPSFLVAACSLAVVLYMVHRLRRNYSFILSCVLSAIALVPTSFVSVIGSGTETFPFSWFHLMIIVAMAVLVWIYPFDKHYMLILVIFFVYMVGNSAFISSSFVGGLKQSLVIVLFLSVFPIGTFLQWTNVKTAYADAVYIYLVGNAAYACQIYVQFLLRSRIEIGTISYYAYRVAYAGLMHDFSFASLYLATGCFLILVLFLEYKVLTIESFLFLECLCGGSMLITSARTGVVSLVFASVIYFISGISRGKIQRLHFKVCFVFITLAFIGAFALMMSRHGAFFSSSGRFDGYAMALKLFLKDPLVGIGLGENTWVQADMTVPHNFFVQYLTQLGLIGTLFWVILFFYFYADCKRGKCSKYLVALVMIGAMLIPDIVSSRFFFSILIISFLDGPDSALKYRTGCREE